eukprot:136590-Rhodomonas_salina.1
MIPAGPSDKSAMTIPGTRYPTRMRLRPCAPVLRLGVFVPVMSVLSLGMLVPVMSVLRLGICLYQWSLVLSWSMVVPVEGGDVKLRLKSRQSHYYCK